MTETEAVRGQALAAFPFPPGPLSGPPVEYAERRVSCPFGKVRLPRGGEAVLLVTYRDVAAALVEPGLSHNLSAPGSPRSTLGPSLFDDPESLTNKEGPDHLRIRRIVASAFTPRRVEKWKPRIEAIAAELLDGLEQAGSSADIVAGYCLPLPVRAICTLLGVRPDDSDRFRDWSNAFISAARMSPQEQYERIGQFAEYVAGLLAQRRAGPGGDDLIDDLLAARDGADRLTEPELVNLIIGLIAAGNEATSNALGRGLVTLLRDGRVLWEQLVARPELVPAAVDELLRYNPLGNLGAVRLATRDVELPSGTVKAGEAVLIAGNAGQLDPDAYEDPETVRFDRAGPPQLVFGGGPHYCLGAHLAKAELQIGLGALLKRLPGLRLAAELDELRFSEGEFLSSLLALPVSW